MMIGKVSLNGKREEGMGGMLVGSTVVEVLNGSRRRTMLYGEDVDPERSIDDDRLSSSGYDEY